MISQTKEILRYHRKRRIPLILRIKGKPPVVFHQCYGSWQLPRPEYEWCVSKLGIELYEVGKAPKNISPYRVS